MRFGEFIFYNTDRLSPDEKTSMFRDCMKISYSGGPTSSTAQFPSPDKKLTVLSRRSLDDFKEDTHVVVIDRGTWGSPFGDSKEHFEIAFRSMESPVDYFLFIEVESEKMPPILSKYHLSPTD
jgi:hypothetical protein